MDNYAPIRDSMMGLMFGLGCVFAMVVILFVLFCASEHQDDKRITDLEHRIELLEESR